MGTLKTAFVCCIVDSDSMSVSLERARRRVFRGGAAAMAPMHAGN